MPGLTIRFEAIDKVWFNAQSPSERWDGDWVLGQDTLDRFGRSNRPLNTKALAGQSPLPAKGALLTDGSVSFS